ncbi:hypothetical protein [Streptomyces virginiae]
MLGARGLPFFAEFHGEDGALLREVTAGGPGQGLRVDLSVDLPVDVPADLPVRPRQGLRQRPTDLFTRKG